MLIFTWVFVTGCAVYALSAPQNDFNYFHNILFWSLVFIVSLLTKSSIIIDFTITTTVIVKIYQLLLTDNWTVKSQKAYVFSLIYPIGLCIGLLTYAHYETQVVEASANKMAKNIVAYHDKTGSHSDENLITREDREYYASYSLSMDEESYLWCKKPMLVNCKYTYLFDSNEWEEYCFD